MQELISVVVPAYNAAATLSETLDSVRAQTHRAIEIVVVDDGSIDDTAAIALRHASEDARVRLVRTRNEGVAAARNTGVAVSAGEYIAPIDADDLWKPTKLARQIEAMRQGGPKVGLVYAWTALLDMQGDVVALGPRHLDSGDVSRRLWRTNLVGSGSCPLLRRQAMVRVGAYDESLHRQQAQGCEDWLLYMLVAQHFEYAVVPEYLTGYRRRAGSMSTDHLRMYRSFRLAADNVVQRVPVRRSDLREATGDAIHTAYRQLVAVGDRDGARAMLLNLVVGFPYQALKAFCFRPVRERWLSSLKPRSRQSSDPVIGSPFLQAARSQLDPLARRWGDGPS